MIGLQFRGQKAVVFGIKRFAQVYSERRYSFPLINNVPPIFSHLIFGSAVQQEWVFINTDKLGTKRYEMHSKFGHK